MQASSFDNSSVVNGGSRQDESRMESSSMESDDDDDDDYSLAESYDKEVAEVHEMEISLAETRKKEEERSEQQKLHL